MFFWMYIKRKQAFIRRLVDNKEWRIMSLRQAGNFKVTAVVLFYQKFVFIKKLSYWSWEFLDYKESPKPLRSNTNIVWFEKLVDVGVIEDSADDHDGALIFCHLVYCWIEHMLSKPFFTHRKITMSYYLQFSKFSSAIINYTLYSNICQ